jgi:4-hydroxy-4-methyl-2-oxoglutarate aldolase
MTTTPLTTDDLALLRQFDTPTICNVIELFDVRLRTAGYMDGRIRACFPEMPPVVGYASTATIRTAFAPAKGSSYTSLDDQVQAFATLPGPPIVVFQDLDDPAIAATFGEIMCSTYQAFGAVALITSGAARDPIPRLQRRCHLLAWLQPHHLDSRPRARGRNWHPCGRLAACRCQRGDHDSS